MGRGMNRPIPSLRWRAWRGLCGADLGALWAIIWWLVG